MRAFLLLLTVSMMVLGCGGGDGAEADAAPDIDTDEEIEVIEDDAPVVAGTWEVIEVTRGEDFSNTGTVYEFCRDGSMTSSSGSFSIEGTYVVSGDTLVMNLGGIDMNARFSFEGENLVYEILNGDQVFLMEPR